MSGSDAPTHNELSAMKVDELRKMCGELGLMVSGKKADLIDRILSQYGPKDAEMVDSDISQEIVKTSSEAEVGDAVDRLLAKFEGKDDFGGAEATEALEEELDDSGAALPEGAPEIPKEGLPDGWTLEQWAHYGNEWLERGGEENPEKPTSEEDEIMVADIVEEPASTCLLYTSDAADE